MERRKSILFPIEPQTFVNVAQSNQFDETRDTLLSSINDTLPHDDTETSSCRKMKKLSSR